LLFICLVIYLKEETLERVPAIKHAYTKKEKSVLLKGFPMISVMMNLSK